MELQQPHNIEAEQALLGAALLDPTVVAECGDIVPEDFFRALHVDIWRAMRASVCDHTDWVTLAASLKASGVKHHENLEAYLQELGAVLPSAYHPEAYARLVKECARRRNIITGCRDAALKAYNGTGTSEQILGSLLTLASGTDGRTGGKLLSEYVGMAESASLSGGVVGLRTGLPALDEKIGGLVPGRLVIVGARPGQGKSSLIAQIAVAAMDAGAGVLMFSLEMSGTELAARMVCSRAMIDSSAYMQGKLDANGQAKARRAAKTLNGNFYIDETPGLDIAELRLRAIRHRAKHGDLGLIVVDYLGLAKAAEAARDSRYLQVGAVSQGLKTLAKELQVPVLAAHQINRDSEKGKTDERPKLAQLRESGNIEQDADQVLLIWPYQKDPVTGAHVDWKANPRPVEISVAKNRHGAQDLLYFDFHRHCTRFTERGAVPVEIPEEEKRHMFVSVAPSRGADCE